MHVRRLVRLLAEPEVHQELLCEVITALGSFAHGTYVLVHVCMYVCEYMHICMYVYMYECMVCVYVCTRVCMYVCVYVCEHMYVCMSNTQYCVPLAIGTKSSIDAVISAEAVPSLSRGMVTIGLV